MSFVWALALPRRLASLPGAFVCFIRTALTSCTDSSDAPSAVPSAAASSTLWPCPLPFAWHAPSRPDSRRLTPVQLRTPAVEVWLNVAVFALSHLALGGPWVCPQSARSGCVLSAPQSDMVARLRPLVEDWFAPPFLQGGRGKLKLQAMADYLSSFARSPFGAAAPPPSGMTAKDFDADRATFMSDPALSVQKIWQFLPTFEAACWQDPRLLALTDAEGRIIDRVPPRRIHPGGVIQKSFAPCAPGMPRRRCT